MIISKYFSTIHDYINVVKCCKEYKNTIEQYKYNPIPFYNKREKEIFHNIIEYHFYNEDEEAEINNIKTEKNITKYIHWVRKISYTKAKTHQNHEFKYVQYSNEDMKHYLFDNEEGYDNFINLKEEDVILEEGITSISDYCFMKCINLVSIKIPNSVTSLGCDCFNICLSLTHINIPTSISLLDYNLFRECSRLSSITIPTSVTLIADSCFEQCTSLKSIDIPSSVISIGNLCFLNCSSLSVVNLPINATFLGDSCFEGC